MKRIPYFYYLTHFYNLLSCIHCLNALLLLPHMSRYLQYHLFNQIYFSVISSWDEGMTLKDELPRSVGAQYAIGEEWRNNSRKNEETEPKQKQCPVVDMTRDGSKV